MKVPKVIQNLWGSATIWTAFVYGVSGLFFMGANILLAHELSKSDFATFSLVLALLSLSIMIAPGGADGIVNRRDIIPDFRLLKRLILTSSIVGFGIAIVGKAIYQLEDWFLMLLFFGALAGGTTILAAAYYQAKQSFAISLSFGQSPNIFLLLTALIVSLFKIQNSRYVFFILTVGYTVIAIFSLLKLFGDRLFSQGTNTGYYWGEGLSILGLSSSGLLLVQMERLLIPKVLSLEDLATFSVLISIVGAPYRLLQMSVGYTLLPKLRNETSLSSRRRLIVREATMVAFIVMAASIVVWYVTPIVVDYFLPEKYIIPPTLIFSAIIAGITKVLNGFTKAITIALIDNRQLSYISLLSWITVGIAFIGAIVGARWGIAGVIYGVSAGWASRALASGYFIAPHLFIQNKIGS